MRFEKLKPNKIKVIIASEDLAKWGVSADAVAKNLPETREMFISLLKQAEAETGFSCKNSRLVIESAMNSRDNDITLFVTKVDSDEEKALFDKISSVKGSELFSRRTAQSRKRRIMTELDSFENVISLCHALSSYFGGTLYSYKDKYYMVTDGSAVSSASEFGSTVSPGTAVMIEEHGTLVAEKNAFPVIRSKFHS